MKQALYGWTDYPKPDHVTSKPDDPKWYGVKIIAYDKNKMALVEVKGERFLVKRGYLLPFNPTKNKGPHIRRIGRHSWRFWQRTPLRTFCFTHKQMCELPVPEAV